MPSIFRQRSFVSATFVSSRSHVVNLALGLYVYVQVRSECLRVLDLSLFHIVPKAVHLEDFVSLQNQVMKLSLPTENQHEGTLFEARRCVVFCVVVSGLGTTRTENNTSIAKEIVSTSRP